MYCRPGCSSCKYDDKRRNCGNSTNRKYSTKDGEGIGDSDSKEDEGDVQELILIEKCIEWTTNLIGQGQIHISLNMKIITLYKMQERLVKEKPK